MAVAFDTSANVEDFGVTTVTTPSFTVANVANRAIAVHLGTLVAISAVTVTGAGQSCSAVSGAAGNDGASSFLAWYRAVAPNTGSQTASASWTTASSVSLSAVVANGVDQTTPVNGGGYAQSASPVSLAISSNSGDLTFSATGNGLASSASTSNQTKFITSFFSVDRGGGGAGPITHTWTLSGTMNVAGANFKQSGGAAIGSLGSSAHVGRGPGIAKYGLRSWVGGVAPAATQTTIDSTQGTWTWAGSNASTTQLILATPGAWTWAGATASFTQLIGQAVGAWTWAGTQATTTQLLNEGVGAWTWAGTTATFSQRIDSTSGGWTWAGSTASFTQLINESVGVWTWAGTQASLAGVLTVDASPGVWSWAGTQAEVPTQIPLTVGAWTWAGAQAATTQLINASVGAWAWSGATASFSQLLGAAPGLWTWAGTQSDILQPITINSTPGPWTWTGTAATFGNDDTVALNGGIFRSISRAWRGETQEERLKRWERDGLIPPPPPIPAPVVRHVDTSTADLRRAEQAAQKAISEAYSARLLANASRAEAIARQYQTEIDAADAELRREELGRQLLKQLEALREEARAEAEAIRAQIEEEDIAYVFAVLLNS